MNIDKNKHEVIIKIDKEEWGKALDKSFKKKVKDLKIDGFRKGKVSKEMYEKKFGIESLYMDAVDYILPSAYAKALETTKLIPVVQPEVDVKSINEDGVEIVFMVITKPEVKLGQYKGLKIEKKSVEVTEKEIETEIDRLRFQMAEVVIKDEKVENGDIAVINFEGFKNDVPFDGGKAENYSLEIGSNSFIPGFEEQLIGMNKNETKEFEITFPEEYPKEEIRNQKVMFKVTVKEVKERIVPILSDEFFNDLGLEGVNSKELLEEEIRNKLKVSKEVENDNTYVDTILVEVAKNIEVEIPEQMINEEIQRMLERYEEQLKMQGINIEQYYQITNSNEENLKKQMYKEGENHVLYRLMLEEIAKNENIIISDEEATIEATKLADKYQMEKEEFLKLFGGISLVKYDLQMRKTLALLKEYN